LGIKDRRRVIEVRDKQTGRIKAKYLSINPELETEEYHELAADALILSDPTGVLDKDELYELLQQIEPYYWRKKIKKKPAGRNR